MDILGYLPIPILPSFMNFLLVKDTQLLIIPRMVNQKNIFIKEKKMVHFSLLVKTYAEAMNHCSLLNIKFILLNFEIKLWNVKNTKNIYHKYKNHLS